MKSTLSAALWFLGLAAVLSLGPGLEAQVKKAGKPDYKCKNPALTLGPATVICAPSKVSYGIDQVEKSKIPREPPGDFPRGEGVILSCEVVCVLTEDFADASLHQCQTSDPWEYASGCPAGKRTEKWETHVYVRVPKDATDEDVAAACRATDPCTAESYKASTNKTPPSDNPQGGEGWCCSKIPDKRQDERIPAEKVPPG